MSPISRKRKKAREKEANRRRHSPAEKRPLTPGYRAERPLVGGEAPPAEAEFLAHFCDTWQLLAKGQPANHCIIAISAMQSVLRDWGVESEPVVVHTNVDWPTGLSVDVGSPNPSIVSKKGMLEWSGHMILWIPSLGRFIDPTIYQANRPESPAQIDRSMVVPRNPAALSGKPFQTAFGAYITYTVLNIAAQEIIDMLPTRARAEIASNTENFRIAAKRLMTIPPMKDVRSRLTMEPLATALALP